MELTEQSTSEEVKAYAAQVVEEVQSERAGEAKPEAKGDARIAVEHADNEHKEIPAEKKSGSESAKSKGKAKAEVPNDDGEDGEGSGEEKPSEAEWLDEDLKTEVAAYGIEESELADFASREELERALRLFDKSALEAGRKALAEGDGGRDEKGRFVKKDAPKADQKPEAKAEAKEGRYEISLNKDVYDEGIVEEFTKLRDHYESRLEALESRFLESDAKAEEKQFDSLVDALGHTDLFGKTDGENAKQLQRRKDLHIAVKAQMLGLAQLGRPTDLTESLVNRVARMVFAEDLGKKDLKNRTRKITRQSNARLGGGVTRPQDARESTRDEADRLYKELAGA